MIPYAGMSRLGGVSYSVMYHNTGQRVAKLVQRVGLQINSEWGKSDAAQWFIEEIYGMRPIFLGLIPERAKEGGDVTFEVDVSGLLIVADVPSLTDSGAYYSDGGGSMWW